jgi:hypothetical protein
LHRSADAFVACGLHLQPGDDLSGERGCLPKTILYCSLVSRLDSFKARFGYKMGRPGAVEIPWKPGIGWGDTALAWHALTKNGNGKA